ncbi:hypothetical protein EV363DRAFT_1294610 [Boletus edulis]|nr:hypothetical protein EV363DRAFT_1294610 [Boletus edulis]
MSQFASRIDQYHTKVDVGLIKWRKMRKKFATATERVQTVVKCQPEDREELQEEMGAWVKKFGSAMDKWDTVRREAITLFVDMDLDDDVAAVIVQAEQVQAEGFGIGDQPDVRSGGRGGCKGSSP